MPTHGAPCALATWTCHLKTSSLWLVWLVNDYFVSHLPKKSVEDLGGFSGFMIIIQPAFYIIPHPGERPNKLKSDIDTFFGRILQLLTFRWPQLVIQPPFPLVESASVSHCWSNMAEKGCVCWLCKRSPHVSFSTVADIEVRMSTCHVYTDIFIYIYIHIYIYIL